MTQCTAAGAPTAPIGKGPLPAPQPTPDPVPPPAAAPITPIACACKPGPAFSDGPIGRLYETVLGRAPDPEGLSWWTAAYQGGASLVAIATGLMDSAEGAVVFAVAPVSTAIVQCYEHGLHRAPDAPGATFWSHALLSGAATVPSMAASISQSAEATGLWRGAAA